MPPVSRRWRNACRAMAILGFLSIVELLVVPQYVYAPGTCAAVDPCFALIHYPLWPTLLNAAINALIWYGVVHVVFLVVAGTRAVVRKGRGR